MAADAPPPKKAPPRSRRRRWLVGCAGAVGVLALVVGIGGVASVLFLQSEAGNEKLTEILLNQVAKRQVEGDFTVGRLDSDVTGNMILYDVKLTDGAGDVVFGAHRVVLSYDLTTLISQKAQIDEIAIDGLVLDLHADERGLLNIQRIFGQTEPAPKTDEPWAGLPLDFTADEMHIRGGDVRYRADGAGDASDTDVHLRAVNLVGRSKGEATRIEFTDLGFSAWLDAPFPMPVAATGSIAYTGDGAEFGDLLILAPESKARLNGEIDELSKEGQWDLVVAVDPLDLDLVEKFAPSQTKPKGRLAGELQLSGPASALHVVGQLTGVDSGTPEGTQGALKIDATVDTKADGVPWKGTLEVEGLEVHDLYELNRNQVTLTGKLTAEGKGTAWPEDVVVTGRWEGTDTLVQQPGKDIAFMSVTTDLILAQGILSWKGAEGDGPLGHVEADGTLNLQNGDLTTDVTGALALVGLEDLGIEDLGGRGNVTVTVDGNVFAEDLPLAARGRAVVAPFTYGPDVRFERLTADFAWRMRANVQHVDVDVVAEDGVAYGVKLARVDSPATSVDIAESGQIDVAGHVVATDALYPDTFRAASLSGPYTVLIPARPTGNIVAADLVVTEHVLMNEFTGTHGTVGVRMNGDDVRYDVDLFAGDRDLVLATGSYHLTREDVVLTELVVAPTRRQRWEGQGTQSFTVVDGGLKDAHLDISGGPLGRLRIDGTVATAGPLDGRVVAEDLQLDVFAELFPEAASGLAGELDLAVDLAGTADSPQIQGTIDGQSLWVPGATRWMDIEGRFSAVREQADVDLSIGVAGEPLAAIDGVIPLVLDLAEPRVNPDGAVDADLVIRPGALERLQWLSETDLGLPPGRISAVISADGTMSDPDFHLTGVVEADVPGWDHRGRMEIDVDRHDDQLTWLADLREGYAPRGRIVGTGKTRVGEVIAWGLAAQAGDTSVPEPAWDDYTLWVDDLDLKASTTGFPVESLLALAGSSIDAEGDLVGGFAITGSPMQPVVAGGLNWPEAQLGEVEMDGALLTLRPVGGGYDLDVDVPFRGEGGLTVSGYVPIVVDLTKETEEWATGDLDLTIGGGGVPLAIARAFDPGISNARGLLVVHGTIAGDPFDPAPELVAKVTNGTLDYQPYGIRASDVDFELDVDKRRVQLKDARICTEELQEISFQAFSDVFAGGGEGRSCATGQGTATLRDWSPHSVNFAMDMDQLLLSYRIDQVFRISGDIKAQGDWETLGVTGGVVVDQGLFVYDSAEFASSSPFEVDQALAIHRIGTDGTELAAAREEEEEVPPFYAGWKVDLTLDLNRSMEVEAELPFVDDYGQLGAMVSTAQVVARLGSKDLEIQMRGGELEVLHEVEIVDGQVSVFSGLFEIAESSQLTFLGDPSNPLLDLTGEMEVTGGEIAMVIQGTPDQPEIEFRSDEFPDQTEIFTILLTGRSPEELTNEQGNGTLDDISGMLINSVLGQAKTHSITVDPDGRVRTRVPVSRDIHAQASVDPTPDENENVYAVSAEVRMFEDILLEAEWGNETRAADVFWEYRF